MIAAAISCCLRPWRVGPTGFGCLSYLRWLGLFRIAVMNYLAGFIRALAYIAEYFHLMADRVQISFPYLNIWGFGL